MAAEPTTIREQQGDAHQARMMQLKAVEIARGLDWIVKMVSHSLRALNIVPRISSAMNDDDIGRPAVRIRHPYGEVRVVAVVLPEESIYGTNECVFWQLESYETAAAGFVTHVDNALPKDHPLIAAEYAVLEVVRATISPVFRRGVNAVDKTNQPTLVDAATRVVEAIEFDRSALDAAAGDLRFALSKVGLSLPETL